MVPFLLRIQRRNSHKTDTRMLLFKIFDLKASKVIKTKDGLAPTAPTEALPEGVGAGGNDYMEVSPKYPSSRLQAYWKVWESFKVHPRVVLVLKQGYCLPFKQRPPLTRFPAIKSSYSSPVKQKALLEAVQQMVQKRAVFPVQNKNSLGFYSRLFLVPKPENKWRPVIDLSVVRRKKYHNALLGYMLVPGLRQIRLFFSIVGGVKHSAFSPTWEACLSKCPRHSPGCTKCTL